MDEKYTRTEHRLIKLRLQHLIFFFIGLIISLYSLRSQFLVFYEDEIGTSPDYISSLQKRTDILNYNLNISIDMLRKSISASAMLKGVINGDVTKEIQLNFSDKLAIRSVTLNGSSTNYSLTGSRLIIYSDKFLSDTFTMKIEYSGRPKNMAMWGFSFSKLNGSPVVYTISEPEYASTWFPCNDRPDDKAIVQMGLTVDKKYTALSNGKLNSVEINGDFATYRWSSEYPISTYLTAVYAAEYIKISDQFISTSSDTVALDFFVFPKDSAKAKKDFEEHRRYLRVFEELFGPYPFSKDKYAIAAFLWTSGAMENQSITGFAYNMITGSGMYEDILVHELAHHWWGNSVGPKNWDDIWLNEGFASYSEALYYEKVFGRDALISTMVKFREFTESESLVKPEFIFSKTVYHKGAWVLHMIRNEIGDGVFFPFLRAYYEKYKYSNASAEDLQNFLHIFTNKDFQQFFKQWVYEGTGRIELDYYFDQKPIRDFYNLHLILSQVQAGYPVYEFPLEIKIIGKNGESMIEKIFVNGRESEIEFNVPFRVNTVELDPNSMLLLTSNIKD